MLFEAIFEKLFSEIEGRCPSNSLQRTSCPLNLYYPLLLSVAQCYSEQLFHHTIRWVQGA